MFSPVVSLAGLGFNASFNNKIWNFINDAAASLENSYKQSITSAETKKDTPLQILQKRLALGEITKEEYEELSFMLENKKGNASKKEDTNEEEKPQNYARMIYDDE